MIKALKIVREVAKYISALLVFFGIMIGGFACCTEDLTVIKMTAMVALCVMAGAIPFGLVNISIMALFDRWGIEE